MDSNLPFINTPPRPRGLAQPESPMGSALTQYIPILSSTASSEKPGFNNSPVHLTRPDIAQLMHSSTQIAPNSLQVIPINNLAQPPAPPTSQEQTSIHAAGQRSGLPVLTCRSQPANNLVAPMQSIQLENQPRPRHPSLKSVYPGTGRHRTPPHQQLRQPVSTTAPWPHGLSAGQQPSPSGRLIARPAVPSAQSRAHPLNASASAGVGHAQGDYIKTPQQVPSEIRPPQQPCQRIHSDQLPSPVQVRERDQQLFGDKLFGTLERDQVPLETTTYIGLDQGNCIPRHMRSSLKRFPATKALAEQLKIPLGLVIQPLAQANKDEAPIQLADHGSGGPVRCCRCRAYINHWCIFTHGGKKFTCNLCSHINEVPSWYFANLDVSGRRVDLNQRPELQCGSIEFAVPDEYHAPRKPVPLDYVFALDVSSQAVRSGVLQACCTAIREALYGPEGCRLTSGSKIGVITYDRSVHFYNLSPEIAQAQMMVVVDIADVFIPLEHGFLVDPAESEHLIIGLLQSLPILFKSAMTRESAFTPAIRSALAALKSTGGNLYIFQSCLPNHGPDALKTRDERALYNSDKEKLLYRIQNQAYVDLGKECVQHAVCVHTWIFPSQYVDVTTVGVISSLTGGDVHYYPNFKTDEASKIVHQLHHDLHRETGYDAVMRVRCSDGLQVVAHYGNCHMNTSTDMDLAGIDQDKAFAVTLNYDSKLDKSKRVYFQAALLYTTCSGERRVRVHNLRLPVSADAAHIFRSGDEDTVVSIILRQAICDLHLKSRREIHAKLSDVGVGILSSYRIICTASSVPGQMILPESFKLLPIYIHAMLRSIPLRGVGVDLNLDSRVTGMKSFNSMGVGEIALTLYPRLYAVHKLTEGYGKRDQHGRIKLPSLVRASYERLSNKGAYLLDTGSELYFWLGCKITPEFLTMAFGVLDIHQVDANMITLPVLNNTVSERIRSIANQLQEDRARYLQLCIVRQGIDPVEFRFSTWMAEDCNAEVQTYLDYVCALHRKIQEEMKK